MTTYKPLEKLDMIVTGSLLFLPILIQDFVGQLPFVNYDWIAGTLPKIETEYQKFAHLFGVAEAGRYRNIYITALVLSNLYFVVFLALFGGRLWRGTFETLAHPLDKADFHYLHQAQWRNLGMITGGIFLFLLIWVIPFSSAMRLGGGRYVIQPGLWTEVVISFVFTSYAFLLPMFLIAIIRFVRR
ncbi:hypothetical protein [Candidatus Halocynthiibacter alkanivorans]|uniref:hypothetical protein n=1 Tax=Candidatus Halocynthiibacter alkanivorans TaxID=2267619 RepID=UPI000DF164C3|nr:hypothetical protein [Candidatus Halocynthiibacter alkanivorans]